jgi:hypothetical protein
MRDVGDMFACGSTARAVRQPQACEPLGKPGGSRAFSADDEYRRNAAEALCEPPAFGLRHFCEVTNGSEFVCLSGETGSDRRMVRTTLDPKPTCEALNLQCKLIIQPPVSDMVWHLMLLRSFEFGPCRREIDRTMLHVRLRTPLDTFGCRFGSGLSRVGTGRRTGSCGIGRP